MSESTQTLKKSLEHIADGLFTAEIDFSKLTETINTYRAVLQQLSPLRIEDENHRQNISLDNGLAIGPKWAAMCLEDLVRTKQFCYGIYNAVIDRLKKAPSKPIRIVYAGTGPYATLVLPLLARFSPAEIQFTLIEINPDSYESVRSVFEKLEATSYVESFLNCDATAVQLDNGPNYDIVIVECMQHALVKEPQVAVSHNLLEQCRNDVILIPEDITLQLALINLNTQESTIHPEKYNPIAFSKSLFKLNKETLQSFAIASYSDHSFPLTTISIPPIENDRSLMLGITTQIRVYGDQQILHDQSGLTVPLLLRSIKKDERLHTVSLIYQLSNSPGWTTT